MVTRVRCGDPLHGARRLQYTGSDLLTALKCTRLDARFLGNEHGPARRLGSRTRLRGFEAMCDAFLGAVRRGEGLDATDALATHEVCERVVRDAASARE